MPSEEFIKRALELYPEYYQHVIDIKDKAAKETAERKARQEAETKKELSIKYAGCKTSENNKEEVEVTFEVTAKNLGKDEAMIYVNGIFIPFMPTYHINPNGKKQITISVPQNMIITDLLKPYLKYTAIIMCDGLSAESEEFVLDCTSSSVSSSEDKLVPVYRQNDINRKVYAVYINSNGTETYRIESDKAQTYIQSTTNVGEVAQNDTTGWVSVPMPNIIQIRAQSKEKVSGTKYQANDYLIAARTGYFNRDKNAGTLTLYTQGGNQIPQDFIKTIPNLTPTLVKAMTIQESHAGVTGLTDIMQVNNPGDWGEGKSKYGMKKGETPSVTNSLYYGIRWLATKGIRADFNTQKQLVYTFKGWENAVRDYNGKEGFKEKYQEYVLQMVKESKPPTPSDY